MMGRKGLRHSLSTGTTMAYLIHRIDRFRHKILIHPANITYAVKNTITPAIYCFVAACHQETGFIGAGGIF